jgi:hypothetical protein
VESLKAALFGPTLFLLYINYVSTIFQNLAVTRKLCAYDIKLYSCYTTNCRSVHDHSDTIERLYAWSQTWQLHLVANKCFVFAVKNPKIYPSDHTYTLINNCLSNVNFIRDLGVTVDSNLKFDKHISLIAHKALVRCRLILKFFHSRDRLLLIKAFCTYVRPLLEYCCTVWSPHYHYLIDKIKGVQRFFTKRLAGLANEP